MCSPTNDSQTNVTKLVHPGDLSLVEKLETQRKLLKLKPTAYCKQKVKTLETEFWKSSEQHRNDYQTKIAETRNTDLMFNYFKRMSKESALPSTVVLNGQESYSVKETLNIFIITSNLFIYRKTSH